MAEPSLAPGPQSDEVRILGLRGVPEIHPGDDLAHIALEAATANDVSFAPGDILVVTHKIVAKAEGRLVDLATVMPSTRAQEVAGLTRKDARLVEVILSETEEVVRAVPNILIVRHRLGFVMANAGVDRSNVGGEGQALLLPFDPDTSAAALRSEFVRRFAVPVGVIICDSFGRVWRNGVVNVALGAAGLPALIDRRGEFDRYGRALEVTEVAFADAIAAGAGLVMGEAAEGIPAVLVRGLKWQAPDRDALALVRPREQDLFR